MCKAHTVGEAAVREVSNPHGGSHTVHAAPLSASLGAAAGTAMRMVALIALMVAVAPETSRPLVTATHTCTAREALELAGQAPCKVRLLRQNVGDSSNSGVTYPGLAVPTGTCTCTM